MVVDHHDDCGEDFSPLGEDYLVTAYYEDLQHDQSGHLQYLEEAGMCCCSLDWHCGMNGSDYVPRIWKSCVNIVSQSCLKLLRLSQDGTCHHTPILGSWMTWPNCAEALETRQRSL